MIKKYQRIVATKYYDLDYLAYGVAVYDISLKPTMVIII